MHLPVKLSDDRLIEQIKALVSEERALVSRVLDHLLEFETRKLFLRLGYSSLFDYAVKELRYSESAAYRRIATMRLLKTHPDAAAKLDDGKLNISTLSQAHSFFKKEEAVGNSIPLEKRVEILSNLEGKSARECEKIFVELSPRAALPDRERVITPVLTEIRFVANETLMKKLERFRNLKSHTLHSVGYAELFEALVDFALSRQDPMRDKPKRQPKKAEVNQTSAFKSKGQDRHSESAQTKGKVSKTNLVTDESLPTSEVKKRHSDSISVSQPSSKQLNDSPSPINSGLERASTKSQSKNLTQASSATKENRTSRYIPSSIKHFIWERDGGKCTYQSPETNRICGSAHQIQVDHIEPLARGGLSIPSNLRLLCRQHNLLMARETFGEKYIDQYISIAQLGSSELFMNHPAAEGVWFDAEQKVEEGAAFGFEVDDEFISDAEFFLRMRNMH